jgi:hypothetical protein
VRTATGRLKKLVASLEGSHAKVCNLDVAVSVEKQIFGLQISVTDVEAMAVVDTGNTVARGSVMSNTRTGQSYICWKYCKASS